MVPPNCGCGWPKTTAARGGVDPSSMMASSSPAGPLRSRRMTCTLLGAWRHAFHGVGGVDELARDFRKPRGLGDHADVAGAGQHDVRRAGNQLQIFERVLHR